MVERLIEPEELAHSFQHNIRAPRSNSLQVFEDYRRLDARMQKQVNMVTHDHESMEVVALEPIRSEPDRVHDDLSDFWLFEPVIFTIMEAPGD